MISRRTRRNLVREFKQSLLAKLGVVIIAVALFVAIFAPFIAPYDPTSQILGEGRLPPYGMTFEQNTTRLVDGEMVTEAERVEGTAANPLGTDTHGRDILSRIIYGARTSLLVAIFATGVASITGGTVGLFAGYFGGRLDDVLMRFADMMLAFPAIILAITLIGMFGAVVIRIPDPFVAAGWVQDMPENIVIPGSVTIVIAVILWVWFARVMRSEVLSVKEEEYVKAARGIGASDRYIMWRHVLPNCLTPVMVLATVLLASVILIESSLSFLGFSGTSLSWGYDIAAGRDQLGPYWWQATMPGLAITFTVIGINLVGDWLRDAFDPEIEGEGGGGGA